MSNDIRKLKAIVTATIEVGKPVGKALADGKVQVREIWPVAWAGMKHAETLLDLRGAWPELRDLDAAEKTELVRHVAEQLDLPYPVAERRALAAFKFLLAGAVFYSEWNLAETMPVA